MRTVIYPGSFDPLTNGHLDIIERACRTFDHVVIALANNPNKTAFLSRSQRLALLKECTQHLETVEIDNFDGLLVEYARKRGIKTVLRGLRAVSDFEYEFMMANMNRQLADDIETVFMMTGQTHFYVSSKLVREVSQLGGDISALVPKAVSHALAHLTNEIK
ncbi:MAG: pantetheine-phosphate adenylyltransferase [Myxococcota bacterium]